MPRLIFKGNVASNTGEYLPAPYIDRVFLRGAEAESIYEVKTSVFVSSYGDKFLSSGDEATDSSTAYASALSDLNYYVMIFHNLEEEYYEEIVSGELNPFVLYNLQSVYLIPLIFSRLFLSLLLLFLFLIALIFFQAHPILQAEN